MLSLQVVDRVSCSTSMGSRVWFVAAMWVGSWVGAAAGSFAPALVAVEVCGGA
jgi:hypothetical protein